MRYEPVIGLEVHAELLTESKVFCACSAKFGAPANENTCPVCLALPGALPVLNRRAVEFAVRAGLAVGCEIQSVSRWARKNYFYPDLPKGYQISQYELPICLHGGLQIELEGSSKFVALTRIHMEEDTGKNIHDAHEDSSLVNFNRCGVPLLEIVSEPEMGSPAEAGAYLRKLRTILQYLQICDGNMEEGSFRCDANVSVRPIGETKLGTKVEIKNMNSFRAVERAIEFEIRRQVEVLEDGGKLVQETRLWDPDRAETRSMRSKESAHDYRYFPEPDLLPLIVSDAWVEEIKATLPELPDPRRERFSQQYGLPSYDAEVLTSRKDLADYFESAASASANPKAISNWIQSEVLRVVNERKLDAELVIEHWPVPAGNLAALVRSIDAGKISGKIAKTVFAEMVENGGQPDEIVAAKGLSQISDEGAIVAVVDDILAQNVAKADEYRQGKDKMFGFFVGLVMKATQGKANPEVVNRLLHEKLGR